jgi:hypothetical protein
MGLKLDGVTQMGVVVNSTSIAGFYALGFFTVSGMRISPNGGNEYMISNNAGEFDVYAGAIHVQRWTSNSIEARKLIDLQSGQVKFPATQIASSDPNTLDDYEEGTFTPTITFGGAAVGVTYGASNGGTYTKVGNRVMVSGLLQVSAKGSSTGSAVLGGLPFSSADAIQGAPSFRFGNLSGVTGMQGYVTGTTIILETLAAAAITNSAFGSGNDVITFTVTYRV